MSDYVTLGTLKSDFKLSPKWIERLGNPDKLVPNPHYRTAAPMKLYLRSRISDFLAEHATEYEAWLKKRQKLSTAQLEIQAKNEKKTIEWAESVKITIKLLPQDVVKAAEKHFRQLAYGRSESQGPGAQRLRGILAMIRHKYSNYEDLLSSKSGMTGQVRAYCIIKERVTEASLEALYKQRGVTFFLDQLDETFGGTEVWRNVLIERLGSHTSIGSNSGAMSGANFDFANCLDEEDILIMSIKYLGIVDKVLESSLLRKAS